MGNLFLALSWWSGALPSRLKLPAWAGTAFINLVILVGALILEHAAPAIGRGVVGLVVVLLSLIGLSVLLWGVGRVALQRAERLGRPVGPSRPPTGREMVRSLGGPLEIFSSVLLWAWGVFYLADSRVHWVNRVALVVWLAYLVAGCVLMVTNWVRHWLGARQSPAASNETALP